MRRGWVGLPLCVLVLLAGCSDDEKPMPTCEIVSPPNGAVITHADDVNPGLDQIQIDVLVRTTGTAEQVELLVDNGVNVPPQMVTDPAGSFTFAGVTLPAGPTSSRLTCRAVGGETRSEVAVSVGPSCALRFVSPIPGQTITRADTRPGPDGRPVLDVTVAVVGAEAGAIVTLEVGDEAQPQVIQQRTLSPDQAHFTVPVHQGANTRFFASVRGGACSPSSEVRVSFDLGQCATSLFPPSGSVLRVEDDLDPNTVGIQTVVCLSTECLDGSNAFLSIDNGQELNESVQGGGACFQVTLSEGSRELSARVESAEQSGVSPATTYCVDQTPPLVTITSPTAGSSLTQADDREPLSRDTLEVSVRGSYSGLTTASCTVREPQDRIEILVNGSVQQTFAPGLSGAYDRVVRLPKGANTIETCAVDQAGNRSCTAAIQVSVDLPVPTLRIESPVTGAVLLRSDDLDPSSADTLELDVTLSSVDLTVGTRVTLEVDYGKWVCTGQVQSVGGGFETRIRVGGPGCAGLSDGFHVLRAWAFDAIGNATQSQQVRINVDNHPPSLEFTHPVSAANVNADRVDVVLKTDSPDGTVVTLQVGVTGPREERVTGGGAIFRGVPLEAGANTLSAETKDAAGNVRTTTITVNRDSIPPAITLLDPVNGSSLSAADDLNFDLEDGFQIDIRVAIPNEADGMPVYLRVGNRAPIRAFLAGGQVTFSNVELAEGENVLRVTAWDSAGNAGTTVATTAVLTGRPQVTMSRPVDGVVLSGRDDLDPVAAGFQLEVSVTSSVPAVLGSCLAIVDPGPNQVTAPLTAAGASCSGVVSLTEGPHVLVAVVEGEQRSGRSLPARVTIDSRAPVLSFVTPQPGTLADPVIFNSASIDVDGQPGFQTRVTVSAGDVSTGQGAKLTVIPESGTAAATYWAVFGDDRRATFSSVTLPGGQRSTLQVTAVDRAGNESVPIALSAVVDRTPPTIAIRSPVEGRIFGRASDTSAAQGFQQSVTVEVGEVESGQNVTLSISPPNGAAPAATYTMPVVAGQSLVTFQDVTFPVGVSERVVLTATVSDRQGNSASDCKAVTVDLTVGEISWFSPPASPSPFVLCGSQDVDPVRPGFQTSAVFRTTGFLNGTLVALRDSSGTLVGSGTVSGGTATIVTTLSPGITELTATATESTSGNSVTSAARSVLVDLTGPQITGFTCNGDTSGDGFLSAAEDGTPATTDRFEMSCTVSFADATDSGRTVRILSTAPAAGTEVGSGTMNGNTATPAVALQAGPSPIGHSLTVSAVDACGNPATGGSSLSFTVDMVAPTVAITLPAAGTLTAANDKNPGTETILDCCTGPGGLFNVTAQVGAGATGQATLKVNGGIKATAAVSGGSVSFPDVPLDQGTLNLTVEAQDAAGNAATSAPVTVLVDSVAPKVTITSPTAGDVGSNQVQVTVEYRDVEAARGITIYDGTTVVGSGVTGSGDPGATRSTTILVALSQGSHTLSAEVSDINGNVTRSAPVTINVTSSDPVVFFESPAGNPAVFNRNSGVVAGSMVTADIVITTSALAGAEAYLLRGGVEIGPVSVVDVGGVNKATFSGLVFPHGETGTLQARVRVNPGGTNASCPGGDANNFCSAIVNYSVDLVAPTLSFASPACKPILNGSDDQPGSDGSFVFTLATDAENGQTVTVSSSGGGSATGNVLSGTATTGTLALPAGAQTLTARVTDAAGNETVVTCETTVDVAPPSTSSFVATRSVTQRRRVHLAWTMPGDNAESGTVASYEIRWRGCSPSASCPIADDSDFNAATLVPGLPSLQPGGTQLSVDVDLVPENRYSFAIRATDTAGNVSALVATEILTTFATDTLAGTESFHGNSVAAANIDGDAQSDLIVGRPLASSAGSLSGGFEIIYGNGTRPKTEIHAANVGLPQQSLLGFRVANAGDVDGDGFDDVLVGAQGFVSSTCIADDPGVQTGAAVLFFGGPNGLRVPAGTTPTDTLEQCTGGGSTDCYLKLAPPAPEGSPPGDYEIRSFGLSVAGVGNVTGTPSGRPLFAVGAGDACRFSTRRGKVFLYRLSGDRPAITVDRVATLLGETDSYHFGAAVCGVGDVNDDGTVDLVVGAHRGGQDPGVAGRAYLFAGGAGISGVVDIVSGGSATDDGIVVLAPSSGVASDGFGSSCVGAGDLDGDTVADFVISAPGDLDRIRAYRGRSDLDASPPTDGDRIVSPALGTNKEPSGLAGGFDIDGDGTPDLVVGDREFVHVYRGTSDLLEAQPGFSFPITEVSTGAPVTILPNWRNLLTGESGLPDIAIGLQPGNTVIIKY